MTPEQCKAARALLGWSQNHLAENALVSRATVADFESRERAPTTNNLRAIKASFYAAGIEMLPKGEEFGEGVRFRERKMRYVNSFRLLSNRDGIAIPMEFAGEPFKCFVTKEALEDQTKMSVTNLEQYQTAASQILPLILNAAENYCKASGVEDEIVIDSARLTAAGH
ncbi:helix-turn-helix transcriptional regulator [Maritimibacter sp. UBA3975]|uniref:helix-turn-helix transcriptional regulator n=1 Tax=Maritimibacter sp. UBA3975 TaxID=1946833 RepID=UPI000C0B9BC0|nr:helix-turn-helix transcriptional regulator [Maritimibacter sp. UBA3975]MAM61006.1 hypothetical protein [Maritimibacter sp.]